MKHALRLILLAGLILGAGGVTVAAEAERPWSDTAEFSIIVTTGNSETENVAFKNKYFYGWAKSSLTLDAGMLRTNTTTREFVNNSIDGFKVIEQSDTTAERYFFEGVYRQDITEELYWYAGAGWDRNEPAGIDNRYKGFGGVGLTVFETDVHSFNVEVGADYTEEEQVSGENFSYAGARAFAAYHRDLSDNAQFDTSLEVLQNLDETDDLRAIYIAALSANLTTKLALKASYTVFFDDQPAFVLVKAEDTGVTNQLFELDDLDTIFAASLVINF